MNWLPLNFGKYSSLTLPQVVFKDPDYFFWLVEENVFDTKSPMLKKQALEIHQKSKSIKIPKEDHLAEFTLFKGKLMRLELVRKDTPLHTGGSQTMRFKKIDLSFLRSLKTYDKRGGDLLITGLKYIVFNDTKKRMTKKACEDFFNDEDNFIVTGSEQN